MVLGFDKGCKKKNRNGEKKRGGNLFRWIGRGEY